MEQNFVLGAKWTSVRLRKKTEAPYEKLRERVVDLGIWQRSSSVQSFGVK